MKKTALILAISTLFVASTLFAEALPPPQKIGLPFENVADATRPISLVIRELIFYTGLLAILVLSYGGILLLTSYGDDSKVKRAKKLVTFSLVGVVLSISSYAIISIINELRL